jgi:hypothetical protein
MKTGKNGFSAVVVLNDGKTYYETDVIQIYKNDGVSLKFQM